MSSKTKDKALKPIQKLPENSIWDDVRRQVSVGVSLCRKGEESMPIISRFFGILIFIFWREHHPPHFHAKYGDNEITVEIETGIINGSMQSRALALVQEWRELHKEELIREWQLAEQKKALFPIKPLE
jgi:hypothetical protein